MEETDKRWVKVREFPAHAGSVNSVCLLQREDKISIIATGGSDKKVNLWSLDKPNCLNSLVGHVTPVVCVKFSMTQDQISAGSQAGVLKIWDYVSSKNLRTLMGHRASIRCMEYHPQGGLLISGSADSIIKLWDIRKRDCISSYKGHNSAVSVIKFSPTGKWIASGGDDHRVKIWDLRNGKIVHEFSDHRGPISSLVFHPTELILASCSGDQNLKFRDLESFSVVASKMTEGRPMKFIMGHPDAKSLFVASEDILGAYEWDSFNNYDSIVTNWSKMQDMTIVGNSLFGVSSKREIVVVASVDLLSLQCVKGEFEDAEIKKFETVDTTPGTLDPLCSGDIEAGENKSKIIVENSYERDIGSTIIEENKITPQEPCKTFNNTNILCESISPSEIQENEGSVTLTPTILQTDESSIAASDISSSNSTQINSQLNDKQGICKHIADSYPEPQPTVHSRDIGDLSLLVKKTSTDPPPIDISSIPLTSRIGSSNPVSARTSSSDNSLSRRRKEMSLAGIQGFSNTKSGVVRLGDTARVMSTEAKQGSIKVSVLHRREDLALPKRPTTSTVLAKSDSAQETQKHLLHFPAAVILNSDEDVHHANVKHVSHINEKFNVQCVSNALKTDIHGDIINDTSYKQICENPTGDLHLGKSDNQNNLDCTLKPTDLDQNALSPSLRDLMSLSKTNIMKNSDVIYAISNDHEKILTALVARLRNLKELLKIWKTKDSKATAKAAIKFDDDTILVEILNIFSCRSSLLNLDLCVIFLPAILRLLQSRFEEHILCASTSLRVLLKSFGPVIKESILSPETLGVDLSQEERRRKCTICHEYLTSIHEFATNQKRGKLGKVFSDISVLLSNLN